MTIGDNPIRHMRVKKASAVKIMGAIINSHSSRIVTKLEVCCAESAAGQRLPGCKSLAWTHLWQLSGIFRFDLVSHASIGFLVTLYISPSNITVVCAGCECATGGSHGVKISIGSVAGSATGT